MHRLLRFFLQVAYLSSSNDLQSSVDMYFLGKSSVMERLNKGLLNAGVSYICGTATKA
jgi:hypothetical protein